MRVKTMYSTQYYTQTVKFSDYFRPSSNCINFRSLFLTQRTKAIRHVANLGVNKAKLKQVVKLSQY